MRVASLLLPSLAVALALGCGYRVRVGEHDAGPAACGPAGECGPGNQCACGQCLPLDVVPPACDPPCSAAAEGDFCSAGRSCPLGPCASLECLGGTFHRVGGDCDAGGWCECPAPPPGCVYDGSPCVCDHLTCTGGERCGRVTCGDGTLCCNASCGVCAAPGEVCLDVVCEPDCSPMQAWGDGPCDRPLGIWVWDGSACTELSGCLGCEGPDCRNAFSSPSECQDVFSACGAACGGLAGATCGPAEYCDFPDPHFCGGSDETGVCRARPGVCPPVFHEVCGCDRQTYSSPCDANGRGVDVDYDGPCDAPCAAQDAVAQGFCEEILGWRWTGTECLTLSGCSCAGADCGALWGDPTDCWRSHEHCPVTLP